MSGSRTMSSVGLDGSEFKCRRCGAICLRDEADIGVGVLYGPWACPECGWSQVDDLPEYLKRGVLAVEGEE